jgi:FkbM family methyltransferase
VCGWKYPDGDQVTKVLRARLEREPVYRGDRLEDALRHVRAFRTAVDVGAHIGAWTRELAKRFSRVVAIEPNPAAGACILENCAGSSGRVALFEVAAGETFGRIGISREKGSISNTMTTEPVGETAIVQPIDSMPLSDIDYMKVHCNGAELLALRGARATLLACRPIVTVVIKPAIASFGFTERDVHDFMHTVGYGVVSTLKPYWVFGPT